VLACVPFAARMPAGALYAAWSPVDWYAARAQALLAAGDLERAGRVAAGARQAGATAIADHIEREIDASGRRAEAEQAVDQARTLMAAGRGDDARAVLERAVTMNASNGRAWLMLADRRHAIGDTAGVLEALAHGRRCEDADIRAEAFGLSAMFELDRGHPAAAAALFREAERFDPARARNYAMEARARFATGDSGGALAALHRGLARAPGDAQLTAALASVNGRP